MNVAMKHGERGDRRARPGRWTVARAWLAGLAIWAITPGCTEPEVLALQHDVYEVSGDAETSVTSGCDELPRDPGAAFGFGLGTASGIKPVAYSVNYEFHNDTVSMSAGASDSEPVRREYDAAFLSSGGEDEFFVELSADFGLRVVNRGVPGGCGVSN